MSAMNWRKTMLPTFLRFFLNVKIDGSDFEPSKIEFIASGDVFETIR